MFLFEINNNQKIANRRIRLVLVLSAGLVFCAPSFAAENVMQSPTGKIQRFEDMEVVEERTEHPIRDFVSSFKFWDKKKPAQTTNTASTTKPANQIGEASSSTLKPVGAVTIAGKTSTTPPDSLLGGSSKTVAATESEEDSQGTAAASGFAPEPPQIPIYQNKAYQNSRVASRQVFSDDIQPSNSISYSENTVPGQSSYSFDSREWVEHYHLENMNPPPKPEPVSQGVISSNAVQNTALHPIQNTVADVTDNKNVTGIEKRQSSPESDIWSGETAALRTLNDVKSTPIANSPLSPKIASAVIPNKETAPVGATESAKPVDLTASYKNRLPHTAVCGVVVVQADFPLTELSSILSEIDELQIDLNKYMGVPLPNEKIELCLFKDETSYLAFLKRVFPNAPTDRRALYIKLDKKPGTLLVQKSGENFEIDLRHEMTHAIIHASVANVPIWLDEGLAKYFELPLAERAEKNPYMKQVRWAVKLGAVPSLNRLTKLETVDEMGTKEYRDSWAWTHFLIHRSPDTHKLLAAYIQMLSQLPNTTGNSKNAKLPPLTIYLNDVVTNQREEFRSHFGVNNDD